MNGLRRIYVWEPDKLPYYILQPNKCKIICSENNKLYASKVLENVPYFKETVTLSPGLVASAQSAPEADQNGDDAEIPWVPVPADGSSNDPSGAATLGCAS